MAIKNIIIAKGKGIIYNMTVYTDEIIDADRAYQMECIAGGNARIGYDKFSASVSILNTTKSHTQIEAEARAAFEVPAPARRNVEPLPSTPVLPPAVLPAAPARPTVEISGMCASRFDLPRVGGIIVRDGVRYEVAHVQTQRLEEYGAMGGDPSEGETGYSWTAEVYELGIVPAPVLPPKTADEVALDAAHDEIRALGLVKVANPQIDPKAWAQVAQDAPNPLPGMASKWGRWDRAQVDGAVFYRHRSGGYEYNNHAIYYGPRPRVELD